MKKQIEINVERKQLNETLLRSKNSRHGDKRVKAMQKHPKQWMDSRMD